MSVWNLILQATHSSLIDELNFRFPDEKLELGLPKRVDGFSVLPDAPQTLFHEICSVHEGNGFTALAASPTQPLHELSDVFSKTRSRTEKELGIRKIPARFTKTLSAPPTTIKMTIWLPISLLRTKNSLCFHLGIGV